MPSFSSCVIVLPCCDPSYSLFFLVSHHFLSFSLRSAAIQACEQQLLQFRGLSGSLLRWLETAQDQLQPKEGSLTTEGLQRRVQQLKVCVCVCVLYVLCALLLSPKYYTISTTKVRTFCLVLTNSRACLRIKTWF